MTAPLDDRISVDKNEAARLMGVSARAITDAHDRGDLIGRYHGVKRLYKVSELEAWFDSLPTQKPDRAS